MMAKDGPVPLATTDLHCWHGPRKLLPSSMQETLPWPCLQPVPCGNGLLILCAPTPFVTPMFVARVISYPKTEARPRECCSLSPFHLRGRVLLQIVWNDKIVTVEKIQVKEVPHYIDVPVDRIIERQIPFDQVCSLNAIGSEMP